MDRPLMNTDYTFPVVVFYETGAVHSIYFTTRKETPAELHESCKCYAGCRVVTLPNIPRQVAYQIRRPSMGAVHSNGFDEAVYNALRCYYTTAKHS